MGRNYAGHCEGELNRLGPHPQVAHRPVKEVTLVQSDKGCVTGEHGEL